MQPSKRPHRRSGSTGLTFVAPTNRHCRANQSFHFRSVYLGLPTPGFQRSVWSDDSVISVLLQIPEIKLPCSQQVWDGILKCWRQSVFAGGDSLCAGGGATAGDIKAATHQQSIKNRYQQVRIGMRTLGFKRYIHSPDFTRDVLPIPDTSVPYSKRAWDRVVRHWRRSLHLYDACPPPVAVARDSTPKRRHTPALREVNRCMSVISPVEMGFPVVQLMSAQTWSQKGHRWPFRNSYSEWDNRLSTASSDIPSA